MSSTCWFAIIVQPLDPVPSAEALDELCAELIERGAAGTAIDRAPEITCYLQGDQTKASHFVAGLETLQCRVLSTSEVIEENWTGACPEVWEPIQAGSLTVVPIESLSDNRPTPPGSIRIIPGLGFGTGHHATTRMVLTAMCEYARHQAPGTMDIFDLGTGSGILAIAASKLFNARTLGNDIDAGALQNARDNIRLNDVGHLVTVCDTPLHNISGSFDLVLANLYGEVLCSLAPEVTRIAKPGATAILSGITEIVWDSVWQAYESHHHWELISEQSEGDWMCAVIRKA